jgi:4'-phosphopantetheinyl transferase
MMIPKYDKEAYVDEITLRGTGKNLKANICFCYFPFQNNYQETEKFLHPEEQEYFNMLKFEKRKKSYLMGRYTAKKAISAFANEQNLENILIQQGVFNQPVTTCLFKQNIQVSITHCDDLGAAIAFPEALPMGIDIEKIDPCRNDVIASQMTVDEKELMKISPYTPDADLTLLWTAKESISKILKTGLTTPFQIFEINKIENKGEYIVSYFKNFSQYYTVSFKLGNYMCSITYPRNMELDIDIKALKKMFNSTIEIYEKQA